MSTKTRNLSNIDGANVGNPDESDFSANGVGAFANDAAFEAMHAPVAGSIYFNTTENCLREYNGTSWQYDKTIFSTQTDSTTTGSNQDITPSVDQIIRFTQGSLASIRGIIPTTQKFLYLVNDQASQAITIQNQAAGATAANRIITGNGADLVVMAGRVIGLAYDEDATRWRVVSGRVPSSALEVHASDAAYQTAHPGFGQGSEYFNSTSLLVRQYNGTAWQNDKTSYETQTDSTTTGASQDISPNTVAQVIRFTHGSLTSIRSISPTNQTVVYFVNGQASQVITIKNEDTGATAANRIVTGTGADFSLAVGQMIALVYDAGGTRWRLAGAASSGGSGTGGVNLITSPSTATGWSETGTVFATPVTTTTSADLPLEGATNSAIQFVATGSGSEATDYNSFPITTSAAMNGKLQVDLFMRPGTGFAASEWTVSVYQGSTRQTLETDSSGVTYLPNATGRFTTSFDAVAGTAYTLRFARVSGSGSATLNVCNVFLGWPFVSSVAAAGKTTSYTPTLTNFGTPTNVWVEYIQVVDRIFAKGRFTAGTVVGAAAAMSLPASVTFLAPGGASNTQQVVGQWWRASSAATTVKRGTLWAASGATTLSFGYDDYTTAANPVVAANASSVCGNSETVEFEFSFAVSEWSGFASTGPAPAEEFAWNSTATATSGSYTSNKGNGSQGTPILAYSLSGTNSASYECDFIYPIQIDDDIELETDSGTSGARWVSFTERLAAFHTNDAGTTAYSVQVSISGTRSVNVIFYSNWSALTGASWSAITSWRWRVRKTKKAALPFKNAGTDGSSGLVAPYTEGSGVVYTGTYTPVLTNTGNISSSASAVCMYTRVGSKVTVSGIVTVTVTTASNTRTTMGLSLPIASNFTAQSDAAGSGTHKTPTGTAMAAVAILGDSTNDRMTFEWNASSTTPADLSFQFQYFIK